MGQLGSGTLPEAPTTTTLRASISQSVVSVELPSATSSATMLSVGEKVDPLELMSVARVPVGQGRSSWDW
jgi:hypothetical protein